MVRRAAVLRGSLRSHLRMTAVPRTTHLRMTALASKGALRRARDTRSSPVARMERARSGRAIRGERSRITQHFVLFHPGYGSTILNKEQQP
jgi:hypothetical protein